MFINILPEFNTRSKELIIGGISGHTILFMELSLLLDVNWIPILFGCIITQYPHHHSLIEIMDALTEMKLVSVNDATYIDKIKDFS